MLGLDAAGRGVELLFVERWPTADGARCAPGRRCRVGAEVHAGDGSVYSGSPGSSPTALVWWAALRQRDRRARTVRLPPLPPDIAHHAKPAATTSSATRRSYARPPGSIAAPTAGLHFTPELLDRIRALGVEVHTLTLHVGPATFWPIKTERIEDHVLPSERVQVSESVARAVNAARAERRRVVAVGTTTTRALESAAGEDGIVRAREGRADVFIVPGHRFRVVDALLTNFHLPRSSLLVLVSAFAGRNELDAYRPHSPPATASLYGAPTLIDELGARTRRRPRGGRTPHQRFELRDGRAARRGRP